MKTAAVFVLCILNFFHASCSLQGETRGEFLLGTVCSITLYDDDKIDAASLAFARVRRIEEKLSVNLPDSEINRVNDAAGKAPVSVFVYINTILP